MLKKLLNVHENMVNQRLRITCEEHGAMVHAKVRVADVLPIENSGISAKEYSFALKSHFDFMVTDDRYDPLFAVEYDGPTHDGARQNERDSIKNLLANRFELPLLRVRSAHIHRRYDGWDLLSWIIDVWFLQRVVDRMYANGELPYFFDFDPALIISSPGCKRRFPYWLGLDAQLKFLSHHKSGRIQEAVPSSFEGTDMDGVRRGFAFIRMDLDTGVRVATAMHSQQFQIDLTEPIRGVLYNDLYHELEQALANPSLKVPLQKIDTEKSQFQAKYSIPTRSARSWILEN